MGRNMKTRLGSMNTMSLAGPVDAPTPSFYVHICSVLPPTSPPFTKSRCFEIKSWQNPSMLSGCFGVTRNLDFLDPMTQYGFTQNVTTEVVSESRKQEPSNSQQRG